jgi:MmgE/PrpD N-terminal domain
MSMSAALAERALEAGGVADLEHLRALTLTNVAAGVGYLGAAGELIAALPLDPARRGDVAYRAAMRLHARTQDDFFPLGRIHPGVPTLAATLALADRAVDRLLDCLAAGYETMCVVSAAYGRESQVRGYRPTGMTGPLGAAASAAHALGLDRDGTANAIGLAAARSSGTNQSWLSGTDEWLLEVGAAARAGVEAALFTEAGAVASAEALEGAAGWARAYFGDQGAARLREALEAPAPLLGGVATKPYPVSGIAQVATDLACRAHARLNGDAPTRVVVRMPEAEAAYPGSQNAGPYRSRSAALMSVRFCVAAGLAEGCVRLDRLERPDADPELVGAVEIEPDAGLAETAATLLVEAGGHELALAGHGDALLYPTWDGLRGELEALAARVEAPAGIVRAAGDALAADRPDARALAELLGAGR